MLAARNACQAGLRGPQRTRGGVFPSRGRDFNIKSSIAPDVLLWTFFANPRTPLEVGCHEAINPSLARLSSVEFDSNDSSRISPFSCFVSHWHSAAICSSSILSRRMV